MYPTGLVAQAPMHPLSMTTAVRHRPMRSRTRLLVGVVLALWLLVVAAAVRLRAWTT